MPCRHGCGCGAGYTLERGPRPPPSRIRRARPGPTCPTGLTSTPRTARSPSRPTRGCLIPDGAARRCAPGRRLLGRRLLGRRLLGRRLLGRRLLGGCRLPGRRPPTRRDPGGRSPGSRPLSGRVLRSRTLRRGTPTGPVPGRRSLRAAPVAGGPLGLGVGSSPPPGCVARACSGGPTGARRAGGSTGAGGPGLLRGSGTGSAGGGRARARNTRPTTVPPARCGPPGRAAHRASTGSARGGGRGHPRCCPLSSADRKASSTAGPRAVMSPAPMVRTRSPFCARAQTSSTAADVLGR